MIDLSKFVSDDEIYINEYDWKVLNEKYNKEDLKAALSDVIGTLPLPYLDIKEKDAYDDMADLRNYNTDNVLHFGPVHTRYEYEKSLSNWYIDNSLIGRKASNYFNQSARWKVDHARYPGPYRAWNEEKLRGNILNALWSMDYKEVNKSILRQCLSVRGYMAAQFPPLVAKTLYEIFGNNGDILDFSGGWGDRLAGFYGSSAKTFTVIDPNPVVCDNYRRQIDFYDDSTKSTRIINLPAEEVVWKDEKFDCVFTSPPYFNIEKYAHDETQSWKRYGKGIDSWLEGFLFPTLSNIWPQIKQGGTLIVNISDVYSDGEVKKICDPMNNFIEQLEGSFFAGTIGLKMSKRPQSKAGHKEAGDKVSVEPMWIWRKGDNKTVDEVLDQNSPLGAFF